MKLYRVLMVGLFPALIWAIVTTTACSGAPLVTPARTLIPSTPSSTPIVIPTPDAGGAGPASAPTISPSPALQGPALVRALRGGGYVIFFRHAATDMSQPDSDRRNLDDCRTQRNLSDKGRADARAIGQAFRALEIPVAQVLASEYCRTRETAQLAFERVTTTRDLTALPSAPDDAERQRRITTLGTLLSTPPPRGMNTILISHLFNIQGVMSISLAEGEAGIFEPRGGNFVLVGRILPEEWAALTRNP